MAEVGVAGVPVRVELAAWLAKQGLDSLADLRFCGPLEDLPGKPLRACVCACGPPVWLFTRRRSIRSSGAERIRLRSTAARRCTPASADTEATGAGAADAGMRWQATARARCGTLCSALPDTVLRVMNAFACRWPKERRRKAYTLPRCTDSPAASCALVLCSWTALSR